MTATAQATQEFLLTIDDYYKMAEVGIIPRDARVELLDGKIIQMSPIKSLHASKTDKLFGILFSELSNTHIIRCQNRVRLHKRSLLQPDLAVAKHYPHEYTERHPEPEDIHLIIEVAQSSIYYDTGRKLKSYARAGIREYWVLDLNKYNIRVYRQPEGETYLFNEIIGENDIAKCETLDFQLTVEDVFG